ncbi:MULTISPECIES: ATP-binding protein [Marinobacter]|uniref:ATP-binding protein n=1 Tax=Marinobacter TaxID=2742 RepID=UPI003B4343B5|nr:ATP-binding protein [Marinobacter alkaliphilus]
MMEKQGRQGSYRVVYFFAIAVIMVAVAKPLMQESFVCRVPGVGATPLCQEPPASEVFRKPSDRFVQDFLLGPSSAKGSFESALSRSGLSVTETSGFVVATDWNRFHSLFAVVTSFLLLVIFCLSLCLRRYRREVARRELIEQRLLDVTQNLPAVIYKVKLDKNKRISVPLIIGNTLKILGVDKAELEQNPFILFSENGMPGRSVIEECLLSSVATFEPISREFSIIDNVGGQRWIATYLVPRRTECGDVHWNGYWVDVTKQHEQAESLAEAKEKAEVASKSTRSFLAAISHEVRTPMSGIISTLELINDSELSAGQARLVSLVADASESLLQILDDVLDFFKLDADKLAIHPEPVDLRRLVDSTLSVLSPRIYAKKLSLRLYLDSRLSALFLTDSLRFRQILFNLVSNATKFTEAGGIEVRLEVIEDRGCSQTVRLQVTDTGIGIDKQMQGEVFVPFAQVDDARTRYLGGTGLGLPICRQLVSLMGGKINLISEPGVGTRVVVDLPIDITVREPKDTPLSNVKVDVSLDDMGLTEALQEILIYFGADIATSVESADLKIRDQRGAYPRSDIVYVTSEPLVLDNESRNVLSSNPFKLSSVLDAVQHCLGRSARQMPVEDAKPKINTNWPATVTILVAEDDALIRSVLAEQLNRLGIAYDIVQNGCIALGLVKEKHYDLMLTDCHMPEMDGFELTRRLRAVEQNTGWPRTTVIGMTANLLDGQIESCFEAGMDDVIGKPIRLNALSNMLSQQLADIIRPPADDDRPPGYYNLLDIFGDSEMTERTLITLLSELRGGLNELREAVMENDEVLMGQLVHRSLGGLRMLDEPALLSMGLAIDARFQNSEAQDISMVAAFIRFLEDCLAGIERWLGQRDD